MKKSLGKIRFLVILIGITLSPVYVFGQDLGSSSKLFRPKSKKAAPKKSSPKKKKSSTRKKTTPKRTSSASKRKKTRRKPARKNRRTAKRNSSGNKANVSKRREAEISRNTIKKIDLKTLQNKGNKGNDDVVITYGSKTAENLEEQFEEAIIEGNLSRNLRNYTRAEESYSRARSIKPKDSRAIYGLGNLYSDQQRWEEAEKAYRRAIELEPENPNARIALSFVLTQPVVGTNVGERYVEAEEMAKKGIELNPKNPFAYDQLGVSKELQGIISNETESAYRTAIKLEPSFALAYAHLGRLLRSRGNTKESSVAYRKAIELSRDVPTMILVAEVLQSQQRFLESEQLLRQALRIDSKHPTALFFLGRALTTRGSFLEAEQVLMKSVDVSPNSFVSYALLGSLYSRQDKWSKAEKTLKKALNVVSSNEQKRLAQEFEAVGDGFMKNKKFVDAVRVYQQAVSLDKNKNSLKFKLTQAEGKMNSAGK